MSKRFKVRRIYKSCTFYTHEESTIVEAETKKEAEEKAMAVLPLYVRKNIPLDVTSNKVEELNDEPIVIEVESRFDSKGK